MKLHELPNPKLPIATQYKIVLVLLVALLIFLVSCTVEPSEINYGTDQCHFCKMTIVDQQHAAQFVTSKGRAHKFDAIECMMKELKVMEDSEIAILLIAAYDAPKKLIEAESAHYLVSQNIPSPMGAYLSGFESEEVRDFTKNENEGIVYDWDGLKNKFSN